jgi:hypothetical protein
MQAAADATTSLRTASSRGCPPDGGDAASAIWAGSAEPIPSAARTGWAAP